MEKIVQQKLNGQSSSEIKHLHIEGSKFGCIEGLDGDFSSLEELEILNCGLKSLKGLPKLDSVKTLLLGDNFLKGEEEIKLIAESCVNLRFLSLVGNRFESVDDFKPLASLESFTSLDVFNCPLTTKPDYRDKVWSLLPKLTVLDGYDKNNQEVTEDDEEDEEDDEDGVGEEDEEDSDEDELGLDYLQKDITDSEDDEGEDDYNPDVGDDPPSDDHDIEDSGDSDPEDGPSSSKRAKLDPSSDDDDDDED